jgi:dTDP-4-dehydrorhamnose reductase
MRILVTGATGMLGATLITMLSSQFEVFGTGRSEYPDCKVPYKQFNLASDNFKNLISWSNPDIIVYGGALTNGNVCSNNPLEAFMVNGISVKRILDATDEKVKLIYISTDAVFPSKLHLAKEYDCVSPENVYGKSKELGEFFLTNSNRKYLIIRTTIVGLNENKERSGFVEWIINSAIEKDPIGLFGDVIFTPISIWDLVNEIAYLITEDKVSSEILHIAGTECCTKHKFGTTLLQSLGFSTDHLMETSISSFSDRAKRCTDQSMDCTLYQKKYDRYLPSLKETIESIKNHYYE